MTIKSYPMPNADEFSEDMRFSIKLDKEKIADTIRYTFFSIFVISLFMLAIAGVNNYAPILDNIKIVVGAMIFSLIPLSLLKKGVEKND